MADVHHQLHARYPTHIPHRARHSVNYPTHVVAEHTASYKRQEDVAAAFRVVCGCEHLYVRRNFPQVTPLVAALAFAFAVVVILGYAASGWVTVALILLLAADVLILVFSRRQLACYRCGAIVEGMRIARFHRHWDKAVADKVAGEPIELPSVLGDEQRASDAGAATSAATRSSVRKDEDT